MTSEQCARVVDALERIAIALEASVFQAPQESETVGCAHENRIRLGVTDGREDWQCVDCRFRSVQE